MHKDQMHQLLIVLFSLQSKPFPKQHILDSPKLKEFADDNFKVDENSRKFSEWVENTLGKGEVALYERPKDLTLSQKSPGFYVSAVQVH